MTLVAATEERWWEAFSFLPVCLATAITTQGFPRNQRW
jgi:hypothetical protein